MDLENKDSEAPVNGTNEDVTETRNSQITPFYEYVFLEYSLMVELLLLHQQSLPGIFVVPSSMSSLIWNGVMTIRQGPYQGGRFKFKILIPDDFPDAETSSIVFTPPVFHPLIHPSTGQLDVSRAFYPWKKRVHHLWNLIAYAKRSFSNIDVIDAFNKEAVDIFQNDTELFKIKVKESIEHCAKFLFVDADPENSHALRFNDLDEATALMAKKQVKDFKDTKARDTSNRKGDIRSLGLTWVAKRTAQ